MARSDARNKLLPPGKIPPYLLKRMLKILKVKDPSVILGPGVGIDAAVIEMPHRMVAVTSDPITLAADLAAWYCVHVNANDLAVIGAVPRYLTVVGLCPPVSADTIEDLFRDLARFCRDLDVTIVGGHTEITPTVNAPILVATMFGPLVSKRIISAASARPGDLVIMTKSAALEATAIIAREKSGDLRHAGFRPNQIRRMRNLLFKPGISVVPEARLALAAGCSAMHDATEGGILTALWEIASASEVGIEMESARIPVLPETRDACRIWRIDPLRAISSGALLATLAPRKASALLNRLAAEAIPAAVIGKVRPGPPSLIDTTTGLCPGPGGDEILKIYA